MVLSFAAYRQSLDTTLAVGTQVHADLFRYPGAVALRVLVGPRHGEPQPAPRSPSARRSPRPAPRSGGRSPPSRGSSATRCACVAAPTRGAGRWLLTDATGSLPLVDGATGVGTLLACSAGRPVTVTAEWTAAGLVPLTVHLADRAVDIGPVADPSFVGVAS